jgi:small subunit ribosomal protein S17
MEKSKTRQKITKTLTGEVVSDKMKNTVVVAVTQITRHEKYLKTIKRIKRFAAHNENKDIKVGDKVEIVEIKPMSKTKHFLLTKKVEA